jgi:hypothetical protein
MKLKNIYKKSREKFKSTWVNSTNSPPQMTWDRDKKKIRPLKKGLGKKVQVK